MSPIGATPDGQRDYVVIGTHTKHECEVILHFCGCDTKPHGESHPGLRKVMPSFASKCDVCGRTFVLRPCGRPATRKVDSGGRWPDFWVCEDH